MEKRLEQIILAAITKVLFGEPSDWEYEVAASNAARAAVKAMREGVVLQLDGAWLPPDSGHRGILWLLNTDIVVVSNCGEGVIANKERVHIYIVPEDEGGEQ